MKTFANKLQKVVIASFVAITTALTVITMTVFAGGPYFRSDNRTNSTAEENLSGFLGNQPQAMKGIQNNNCRNASNVLSAGYCGYLTQDTTGGNASIYKWSMGTTNISNIYHWCAYIPASIASAAVRYDVWELNTSWNWYVLVNQANMAGKYVYLGFSDKINTTTPDTSKYPVLRNACQSGYSCDGRRVYFDTIEYTTYPTGKPSCQ